MNFEELPIGLMLARSDQTWEVGSLAPAPHARVSIALGARASDRAHARAQQRPLRRQRSRTRSANIGDGERVFEASSAPQVEP